MTQSYGPKVFYTTVAKPPTIQIFFIMKGLGKMANKFKRMLTAMLALVVVSTFATPLFAESGTTWRANNMVVNVTPSDNEYNFMIVADKDNGSLQTNFYYYETSNHVVQKTGGGAVHLIPVVNTAKVRGNWNPNGPYILGKSNYDVVYCCDAKTPSEAGVYYKRINLEDSEYYTEEQAKKIRAILTNAYPFISVKEMKDFLAANGFKPANELDTSEIISAVQGAIWSIANKDSGDKYDYLKTAKLNQKLGWGGYMNEVENTLTGGGYTTSTGAKERINTLKAFLLALPGVEAKDNQIVISNISFAKPVEATSNDLYTVAVNVELNHGADENDNIVLAAYIDGKQIGNAIRVGKATNYTLTLNAKANSTVKVVVSGTQNLEKGVYFYVPKPVDVDGDGIATSREVSQNLVGVANGETPIRAEADISFENVSFKSGEVSNISYMFINKETGEVKFMKKIDVNEGATSAPIISMEGYVSAMFMKQATSGMFWVSEEVDEEIQNATIACLKAHNPSYKGHNAIAFGAGNHTLEFKKNKFATYSFDGDVVYTENETVVEEEETVVEETGKNNKNNGNNKNKKNKNK